VSSPRTPRRWAVHRLGLETALALLAVLTSGVIVGTGPMDYRYYGWLAATTAGITAMVTVPLFVLRTVWRLEDRQDRRLPTMAVALVVVVALATAGMRTVERGVIWPWTPVVTRVIKACPGLQAAGLDRVWPADTRALERDETDRLELGDYSYCSWGHRPGRAQDAPYIRLTAVVRRHSAYRMYSPIAMAIRDYHADRAATSKPVSGLGDEAFTTSVGDEVMVRARRANVTISIDVTLDSRHQQEAEAAARALTAAILADIHPGDGTGRR
jgi:hypothetical protein